MPRHDPTAAHPTPTSASREARPLPRPSLTGAGLALSSPRYLRAPGRGGLDYGLRDGSPGGGRRPARAPSTGSQGSRGHLGAADSTSPVMLHRPGARGKGHPLLKLASPRLIPLKKVCWWGPHFAVRKSAPPKPTNKHIVRNGALPRRRVGGGAGGSLTHKGLKTPSWAQWRRSPHGRLRPASRRKYRARSLDHSDAQHSHLCQKWPHAVRRVERAATSGSTL